MARTGLLAGMYDGVEPPYVPGMEIAGTIDELGDDIDPSSGLALGTDVVGFVDFHGSHGGYSDALVLPAASVTRMPRGATYPEAASFLNNALTARNTLDTLALPPGATLLVTGAAGAVGGYLTQIGAAEGLRIVAVAAPEDEELVRSFGATDVVPRGDDIAARVLAQIPDGVDAVADPAVLQQEILPAIRDDGQIGALRSWTTEPPQRGITLHWRNVRERATDTMAIGRLRDLAENGALALRVAEVFPADQAAEAHRLLDRGGLRGRLVIDFSA
jgi:NADPH:quinone reductase-like Zn-dependent oxidoreductase